MDVKRLPAYGKIEVENHTSWERPKTKNKTQRSVFWK
jgi:hypothetical protein